MAKTNDPQLYTSGYDRNALDRYWTNPWVTNVLLNTLLVRNHLKYLDGPIWEPAAGRGDMTRALQEWNDNHLQVYSSDIDMSEFDYRFIGPGHERSFLDEVELPCIDRVPVRSIITNPPFNEPWRGIGDDFVRHGLKFFNTGEVTFMAMLQRSEYRCGKSRKDMFGECPHFMGELVLTTRPRWDYGDPDAPEKAAPRHNFSWFLWSHYWRHNKESIQLFDYRPKGFQP